MPNLRGMKIERSRIYHRRFCYLEHNSVRCLWSGQAQIQARRLAYQRKNTLLLMAAVMGGVGALFGMHAFRHKTKRLKFKIGVPLLLVLNIAVIALFVIFNPIFLHQWKL